MHIDHLWQSTGFSQVAHDLCRGAQAEVRLHLDHGEFQGAITKNLHNQGPVELDVGLHQDGSCRHLPQQMAYRFRVRACIGIGRTALEHLLPHIGELDQHATHGQAIEQKFMQLRHHASFFRPALKRFLFFT